MRNKVFALTICLCMFAMLALGSGEETTTSENNSTTNTSVESTDSSYTETKEEPIVEEVSDGTENLDMATKNAYKAAKNYLSIMAFSKQGLIDQLSSEYGDGYTVEQATEAVQLIEDNGEVDWNEQAVKAANEYLDTMAFSRANLIEQLSSEYGSKFTKEQAEYAVDQVGL